MDKGQATQEEAEPKIPDEQLDEMADVLGIAADAEGDPAGTKPEGKESDQQKDQPPKDEPAEDAKDKGGTESKTTEPTDKAKETPAEEGKKKTEDKDDPEFEVVSKDGVRDVKLSALKTTYQQHAALQSRHMAVKPIFDLSERSGIPVDKMFDFLVLGIQTVSEAANRKQSLPGSIPAGNKPEGYQGPFESEKQENELKESDPILYRTTKALWDQNRALSEAIVNVTGKLEQQGRAAAAQSAGQPTPTNAEPSPERKRVDGLLNGLQTVHADYFKAHPERHDAFKTFLGTKFASVPLGSVDDNFMAVAFQTFDPSYYAAWHEDQVKAKLEKGRQTRRRTFGETDSVRGSVASSMTEQQEHMADILSY